MTLKYVPMLMMATLIAMPAAAQDKAAEQVRKNNPDKMICRMIRNTGSRLGGSRECHTKAEWEQMSSDAGNAVRSAAKPN